MTFVHSSIDIGFPYTHSTGPVVGRALAALRERSILGARCASCARVTVPAREWCELCGGTCDELVPLSPGGTITVCARAHDAGGALGDAWVLVRIDGAACDLVHRARGDVTEGARVHAVWREERIGAITDIECFAPGEPPEVRGIPAPPTERTIEQSERNVSLPYTLTAGTLMSRFYDHIARARAIHGVRCTACSVVIVPPSVACQRCWADTEGWIPVADRGIVTTFVIVNVPFHGQQMPLPYVLARVLLDGADTSFLHVLGEIDARDARMGMRVEAVWRDERTGFLNDDVEYFRPTGEPDAPVADFIDRL